MKTILAMALLAAACAPPGKMKAPPDREDGCYMTSSLPDGMDLGTLERLTEHFSCVTGYPIKRDPAKGRINLYLNKNDRDYFLVAADAKQAKFGYVHPGNSGGACSEDAAKKELFNLKNFLLHACSDANVWKLDGTGSEGRNCPTAIRAVFNFTAPALAETLTVSIDGKPRAILAGGQAAPGTVLDFTAPVFQLSIQAGPEVAQHGEFQLGMGETRSAAFAFKNSEVRVEWRASSPLCP